MTSLSLSNYTLNDYNRNNHKRGGGDKMQYLPIGEPIEMGVLSPQQMAPLLEQVILPSIETCAKM